MICRRNLVWWRDRVSTCNKKGGWYNFMKKRIPDIANAGTTHVWLPPPSQHAAPQGYFYSIINQAYSHGSFVLSYKLLMFLLMLVMASINYIWLCYMRNQRHQSSVDWLIIHHWYLEKTTLSDRKSKIKLIN